MRLPVAAAFLETSEGSAALDGALALCDRYGLGCVLALRFDQRLLFAEAAQWGAFVAQWGALAQRYVGRYAGLAFDLLDRPHAPDTLPEEALAALGAARLSPAAARRPQPPGANGGRAWNALALNATRAIRAIDERRTLVVESNQSAGAAAFAHLRPTRDPHTIYSFHCFEPEAFTLQGVAGMDDDPRSRGSEQGSSHDPAQGTFSYPGVVAGERWDRSRLQSVFDPVVAFRRTYEAPVYLGAFGASAGAPRQGQLTWVRSLLSLCHGHGIGWAYWTYNGGAFGLVCESGPYCGRSQYANERRLDYDLLGVLQSEA